MHASLPDGEVICSRRAATRFAGSRTARYSSWASVTPSPVSVCVLPSRSVFSDQPTVKPLLLFHSAA